MGVEQRNLIMEITMLEIIQMVNRMVMENIFGRMDVNTKAISRMDSDMEKVFGKRM